MASAGGLLRLIRWPGAVTAAGNAATCFLLAHAPSSPGGSRAAAGAVLAGVLVYAGGVVLNDVADAEKDRALHPGRPIPSGAAPRGAAAMFGVVLLVAGVAAATFLANGGAGLFAATAALCAVLYDFAGPKSRVLGVVLLGLARAANAAVGGAAALGSADEFLDAGRFPSLAQFHPGALFAYTALLTWISGLEDEATTRSAAGASAVLLAVCAAAGWPLFGPSNWVESPGIPLAFLAGTLVAAAREAAEPGGPGMGAVVRAGVFGFLLLDAAWLMGAAKYQWGFYAILVYVALRLSLLRARS